MKKLIILSIIILLSPSLLLVQDPQTQQWALQDQEKKQEKKIMIDQRKTADIQDEDLFPMEEDIIRRRLEEKKLQPLSNKKKIRWSFKMAKTTVFL